MKPKNNIKINKSIKIHFNKMIAFQIIFVKPLYKTKLSIDPCSFKNGVFILILVFFQPQYLKLLLTKNKCLKLLK